ncbi:MAG TPA: serine/threonine-protein kinase [Pseudomonadota bacterium]|nr:serine/threonine-protein kinase [Pseudomonadota bacterium]
MSQGKPMQLGRYENLQLLGQGGMGAVYRGHDPSLQRTVAIKVMLGQNPEFLARFEREARAVARLSHPNVVQVYDFGRDEQNNPFFVMELLPGRSLDSLLKEKGPLPPVKVVDVLRQAADGLQAAHAVGIIHRDIKPHNLMLDDSGNVKIVDFGIARDTGSTDELTSTQATPGTLHYMAPEVLSGQPADARADIYALGLVGFHLLAGKPPFTGPSAVAVAMKQINEPLPDLRDEVPGVPSSLRRLIERMTEKRPESRAQTCQEVVKEASLIAHELIVGHTSPSHPPKGGRGSRGILWGAAGCGIVVAAVLMMVVGKGKRNAHTARAGQDVVKTETPDPGPPHHAEHRPNPPIPAGTPQPQVTVTANPTPPPGKLKRRPNQGPLRVAVLKFKNLAQNPEITVLQEGLGEALMDAIIHEPSLKQKLRVLERNQFDEQNLVELLRGKADYMDPYAAVEIGKIIGAEVIVQGSFEKQGNLLRVTTRITSLREGDVLDSAVEIVPYSDQSERLRAGDLVAEKIKKRFLALVAD